MEYIFVSLGLPYNTPLSPLLTAPLPKLTFAHHSVAIVTVRACAGEAANGVGTVGQIRVTVLDIR